jgi:hypothetical protein
VNGKSLTLLKWLNVKIKSDEWKKLDPFEMVKCKNKIGLF